MIYYFDYLDYEEIEVVHERFEALERERTGQSGRLSYLDDYTGCRSNVSLRKLIDQVEAGSIIVIRSVASLTSFKAVADSLKDRVYDSITMVIEDPYLYLKNGTEECHNMFKLFIMAESRSSRPRDENSPIGKKLDKEVILEIEKLRSTGASIAKIARILGVSQPTAKKYSKNIIVKIDKKQPKPKKTQLNVIYKKDYSNFDFLSEKMLQHVMNFMLHQTDPNTQRIYYYDFKHGFNFLAKNYGCIKSPYYFDEAKMQSYLNYMIETESSVRVVRRRMYNFKGFFKYLTIRQHLKINPVSLLKLPKITRYEVITPGFTKDELKKLIQYKIDLYKQSQDSSSRLRNHRNLMIIKLLASTGMRSAGIVNLKKQDVSFADGKVILRIYRKGKSDKQHMLLNEKIGKDLLFYMNFHLKSLDGLTPVFCANTPTAKKAITANALNRMLKKAFKKLDINPNLSAHSFRVSFAEHASEQMSLEQLSKQLDHSDIKQTASYLKNTQKQIDTPWAFGIE